MPVSTAALLLSLVAATAAQATATPPAEPPPGLDRPRLERFLQGGDRELVAQSFRRHRGEVLAFVDHYLESNLKRLEEGATEAEALEGFRTGVKFATVASEAFKDPIFLEYAANFASWTPPERANFRAGQKAFREGMKLLKAGSAAEAATSFDASYTLASNLGDAWGMAMALDGGARAKAAQGLHQEASGMARDCADRYARLCMDRDEIDMWILAGAEGAAAGFPETQMGYLRAAASKVQRSDPTELKLQIGVPLVAALEKAGRKEEAAVYRRELGVPEATTEKPAPPAGK